MKSIVSAVLILLSVSTLAQDAAKGAKLYSKCISCHGSQGEGKKSMKAPRIAGQFDWYIYKSLVDFKKGERKNPTMLPFIKNLSDQDYKDLSAYISTLK